VTPLWLATVSAGSYRKIGADAAEFNGISGGVEAKKRFPIVYRLIPARRATIT
jgi:hypothetical protein